MKASLKRIWNKLLGQAPVDTSMTDQEREALRIDLARKRADDARLGEEIRLRHSSKVGIWPY
jgi:hypothetical protein